MKRILIATDFRTPATNAHEYGLQLAQDHGFKVTTLHVYNKESIESTPIRDDFKEALHKKQEEKAKEYFEKLGQAVQKKCGTNVKVSYELRFGLPVEEILSYASFHSPQMLIIGNRIDGGLEGKLESWLGNRSTRLLKKAQQPVLVIPSQARYSPVKHLVYATNFSEKEQRIPKELRMFQEAKISCVHVRDPKEPYSPLYHRYIEEFSALEENNFQVGFYSIQDEAVLHGLDTFMKEKMADMLVMMRHEKIRLFSRLFSQSLSKKMSFHSLSPLLVLRQKADRKAITAEGLSYFY